eukprot:784572-Pelagomonas_calceolata.AAC.1
MALVVCHEEDVHSHPARWFTAPEPFFTGGLSAEQVRDDCWRILHVSCLSAWLPPCIILFVAMICPLFNIFFTSAHAFRAPVASLTCFQTHSGALAVACLACTSLVLLGFLNDVTQGLTCHRLMLAMPSSHFLQAAPVIDEALEGAIRTLQEGVDDDEDEAPAGIHVTGVWTVQIHVSGKTGEVTSIEVLADTLVGVQCVSK